MMERKVRLGIGIGLIIIIIIMVIVMMNNKEEYFKNEVTIEYPSGCKETYVDTKLVGEKCKRATPYTNIQWNLNLSDLETE